LRCCRPPLQQPLIEFKAHQEHEQHQAQLAQQAELGAHRRTEQPPRELGRQAPQQAGPEQDAAHDVAQHAGLAEAIGQLAQQLGHRDHQGYGQQGNDQGGKLHGRRPKAWPS
jgi:hypothetical protein